MDDPCGARVHSASAWHAILLVLRQFSIGFHRCKRTQSVRFIVLTRQYKMGHTKPKNIEFHAIV